MPAKIKRQGTSEKRFPILNVLQDAYRKTDANVERAKKKIKTTCTKGCADCCYLLTLISFPEALLIASKLSQKEDWSAWAHKLKEGARASSYPGITRANYLRKKIPCVFLSKERTCLVYKDRPACCRYHISVGDPADCSPDAPDDVRVKTLDLRGVEEQILEFGMKVAEEHGLGYCTGPIPLMVAFAWAITEMDEQKRVYLTNLFGDLPLPDDWMMEALPSLGSDGAEKIPITIDSEGNVVLHP